MFISDIVEDLIADIKINHQDWIQYAFTLYNKNSGKQIWTANGVMFIDFYPNVHAFNIFEQRAIHRAIKYASVKNAIGAK